MTLPQIVPAVVREGRTSFGPEGWTCELKYDGYRGILYFENGVCKLKSRTDNRLPFPKLEKLIEKRLTCKRAILDGEVCSLDPSGRPNFNSLQRLTGNIVYIAFDLLWVDDEDLRSLPLGKRKARLRKFLTSKMKDCIREALTEDDRVAFWQSIVEHDLEGMVMKRTDDGYRRNSYWYKLVNPAYSGRH